MKTQNNETHSTHKRREGHLKPIVENDILPKQNKALFGTYDNRIDSYEVSDKFL